MLWAKWMAEGYLEVCIEGLPTLWWIQYRGPCILEVLHFLSKTTPAHEKPEKGQLYKATIGQDGMPDPFAFLAYCLHVAYTGHDFPDWYIEKIRVNGWASELFKVWDPVIEGSTIPTVGFHQWARDLIKDALMPIISDDLSEAHQAFQHAVVGNLFVQRVTRDGIKWTLSKDINKDPMELRLEFEGDQATHHSTPPTPVHSHTRVKEEAEQIELTVPQPSTPLEQPEEYGRSTENTTHARPATEKPRLAQDHDLPPEVDSGVPTVLRPSREEHQPRNAGTRSSQGDANRAGKRTWRDAFVEVLGGEVDDVSVIRGMVDHQARIDAVRAKERSFNEEEKEIDRERDVLDAVDLELIIRRGKLEDDEREANLRRRDFNTRCGDYYDRKDAFTTWKDEVLQKLAGIKAAEDRLEDFLKRGTL